MALPTSLPTTIECSFGLFPHYYWCAPRKREEQKEFAMNNQLIFPTSANPFATWLGRLT